MAGVEMFRHAHLHTIQLRPQTHFVPERLDARQRLLELVSHLIDLLLEIHHMLLELELEVDRVASRRSLRQRRAAALMPHDPEAPPLLARLLREVRMSVRLDGFLQRHQHGLALDDEVRHADPRLHD